jgi:carbamoyl-phosphate synthase large subunit
MPNSSRIKILFTSAGRRVALIRAFRESLHRLGLDGRIYAGDAKGNAPGLFVADEKLRLPPIQDERWIPTLKEFCREKQIQLLVPLIDPELVPLSRHREEFAALGTTVLVCSEEANKICSDKRLTNAFFEKIDVGSGGDIPVDEIERVHDWKTPLLLKPAFGSSSIGVVKVKSLEELKFYLARTPNPIVQRLLEGSEYTIDALVDFSGKAVCAVPRLRLETRAGEISKGVTCKRKDIMEAARRIAESLPGTCGCLTIQCFSSNADNALAFTEINPRFGGGFPLSYAAGADYPGWILARLAGKPFSLAFDNWRDGLAMLRYDAAMFLTAEELE